MGHATTTLPSEPLASLQTERPAAPRRESGIERRAVAPAQDAPPEAAPEALDFAPHDTIPAPPWLGDDEDVVATEALADAKAP